MLDATPHLPEIVPMTGGGIERLKWKGALSHIGPVSDYTPLQEALQDKTNCALYMIYIGCVGFCIKRTETVLDQSLSRSLVEAIYAYQFDWRYPSLFGITIEDIDDHPDQVRAIRRSIAYFFFEIVERMPSFFLSERPYADVSFMINLTRFICGPENASVVDRWVKGIIERMNQIAAFLVDYSPEITDFSDRQAWEKAVLEIHGNPLPLTVLDLSRDMAGHDLRRLAIEGMNSIDPTANRRLTPPDELISTGFSATPYRVSV